MHFYNNNTVYQSNSKYNNDQAGYFILIFMMFEFCLGGVIFQSPEVKIYRLDTIYFI